MQCKQEHVLCLSPTKLIKDMKGNEEHFDLAEDETTE